MDKAYFTDAILLYAPSQIALAAVLYAASKLQENLDAYVTETLFEGLGNLNELITAVKSNFLSLFVYSCWIIVIHFRYSVSSEDGRFNCR